MEVDLKLDDLEPIQINFSDPVPTSSSSSSNFGTGIELLMNEKAKSSDYSTTIDMKDLDDIENELNDLSTNLDNNVKFDTTEKKTVSGFGSSFSSFFGGNSNKNESENIKIITEDDQTDSRIGQDTADTIAGNTRTWDGYSKVADVPSRNVSFSSSNNLTDREKRRKKRTMLRNLEDWYERGLIKTPTRYTMDSTYEEIEDEYEGALEDKRKKDSVKIQQNWMVTMINTIEYGNAFFDPFGINLDGWGEAVSEDIDSYDEIFEQLYEKYKGGKMSPELSLLLKLAFTASTIHFTNTTMSRAVPGISDVMRQNPDLMKMFSNATVESMKKSSPGMAFASELLSNNKPSAMNGPPPPVPVETRNQPPPPRPGAPSFPGMQFTMSPGPGDMQQSNRPDISMGRGAMFREQGMDINAGYQNLNEPPPPERSMRPPPQQPPQPSSRPEMSGPKISNIDGILSGLKTKTINIRDNITPGPPQMEQPPLMMQAQPSMPEYTENDSVISIASLKDMQNTTMPKKTNRRKPRSDKNVVSLDI